MNPATITTPAPLPPTPATQPQAVELLTPQQLARRLSISRRSLSTWTRDQVIPMIKIGRVCRFDFAKVRAALEQYERPAAASLSQPAFSPSAPSLSATDSTRGSWYAGRTDETDQPHGSPECADGTAESTPAAATPTTATR